MDFTPPPPCAKVVWNFFAMFTLCTETSSLRTLKIMPRNLNEINVHEFGFWKMRGEIIITQGRLLTHVVYIAWEFIDRYRIHSYHRLHRVAPATFWRTFHHDGKIGPGWWGWGMHAHPLSLNLPSRPKLWCTPQLRGQTLPLYLLYPYIYSVENTVSYMMQNKYKNVRSINRTGEVKCYMKRKYFYKDILCNSRVERIV